MPRRSEVSENSDRCGVVEGCGVFDNDTSPMGWVDIPPQLARKLLDGEILHHYAFSLIHLVTLQKSFRGLKGLRPS